MSPSRRTFVLIHGAWHGGWVWRPVVDRLEAQGHYVVTPTLTGLADRSHLLSASVDLDMHIADIVNTFEWNDLTDVTLVAHSYGGWPVSGAIQHILPRLSSLVYLDAFAPHEGEMGTDTQTPENAAILKAALAQGELSRPVPPASFFHIRDPKDAAWVAAKMTPQPLGVAFQKLKAADAREKVKRKAYIRASESPSPFFAQYYAEAKAKPDWRTALFDSGHEIMLDAPDHLTEFLLQST